MTRRITTRRISAGLYRVFIDGHLVGDLFQDFWTPHDPWRFTLRFTDGLRTTAPYRTKADALAAFRSYIGSAA